MPRTNTGRIVYDRKFHPFKLRDVFRILKSDIPGTIAFAVGIDLNEVAEVLRDFFAGRTGTGTGTEPRVATPKGSQLSVESKSVQSYESDVKLIVIYSSTRV